MEYVFLNKQNADKYKGGSYLYEIKEMNKQEQIDFFYKIIKIENLVIKKIKVDYYFDGELMTKVLYGQSITKEELMNRFRDSNITQMKVKGVVETVFSKKELISEGLSVSCNFVKNNVMIKTDIEKEKKYKKLLHSIFGWGNIWKKQKQFFMDVQGVERQLL